MLDRRFVGLTPNIFKPIQTARRIKKMKQELSLSPFNYSLKVQLSRLYMERKQFHQALPILQEVFQNNPDSDEIKAEFGYTLIKTGEKEKGTALIEQALQRNPRVKYGEPLLQLAETYTHQDPSRAVEYLERFKDIQSSSCEAYYRLGRLYKQLGRHQDANVAFKETVELYKSLPKYKKKSERRWAMLASMQSK